MLLRCTIYSSPQNNKKKEKFRVYPYKSIRYCFYWVYLKIEERKWIFLKKLVNISHKGVDMLFELRQSLVSLLNVIRNNETTSAFFKK
ncbi:MAG: hypothetical protein RLZZ410_272 [Pseudomonadota bacterium]|jgi:hypothetical protein